MLISSIKTGIRKGIGTTWFLAKTIVPVYIFVTVLNNTPIIDWITTLFEPLMGVFNLPGEAAIVLVVGNILNLYAAIGAIKAIELTATQVTILAIMLSFSHSLLVETAVTRKLGFKVSHALIIRVGLAVISGIIVGRMGAFL
ncbi:nucleoside recognition protein [Alkaliphilus sp. MSJ-5]|uniref:Nucleoside recognition protein n=1 Tax=Alkaliphilus flagellatus TaxID=2841507 RepID=A0ABS6G5Z6_9FIRM|nr:nucleoside recognition domain-containing protein [Alkaliphilus flagellatus]MBU5676801.1 nucleoside recognition protein [Alkaliphilus flagellatus]